MPCKPVEFNNVNREHWNKIKESIKSKAGLAIQDDRGEAGLNSIKVKWEFNEPTKTLIVQCTKKPWIYPEGVVNDRIREEFGKL